MSAMMGHAPSYSFELSKWADALIPAAIIAVAFLQNIAATIPFPRRIQHLWKWLTSPFRNFLTLDDLSGPVDRTPPRVGLASRLLSVIAALQFAGWTSCLIFMKYLDDLQGAVKGLILSLAWGYIALTLMMRPPLTPPYLFLLFAGVVFAFAVISFVDDIFLPDNFHQAGLDVLRMIGPVAFVLTASALPLKTYKPSLNVAGTTDIPSVTLTCPEDGVTLWTWCTFNFVQPILDLANTRTIQASDVWSLSPFFGHKNLYTKYSAYRERYPSHSIIRFLVKSNSLDLILSIVLDLYSSIAGFIPFYALNRIIRTRESSNPDVALGFKWTMVIFVVHLSFAWKDLFQSWYIRRAYERTRGQLMNIIQEKALKKRDMAGKTQGEDDTKDNADLGKIVNLMHADVYSVAQRFWELNQILSIPLRIVISMGFLFKMFGWSGLVGVLVVLVSGIFYWPLVQYEVGIQRAQLVAKDIRMRRIDEMFQNIRFLKFFGWEYEWSRRSNDAREEELRWRVRANTIDTITSFIWIWMPLATALGTFMSYTLLEHKTLTVADAFTALGLFQQLQMPMVAFPGQVQAMYQAHLALQRIEDFINEEEVPAWACSLTASVDYPPAEPRIGFEDAVFEWSASSKDSAPVRFQLGPLNVSFPLDKLTVVSGATGSGKSALLVALLGEMHKISGKVIIDKTNHQVAYCAQKPWLESLSIRDNIIFGSSAPFDDSRYQAVLDACALRPDLAIMKPHGDRTRIGEKGITLSGGQRARIALARAMYSQAKYILLDDPLAAVDMHTASHLVHNCLGGELARGRTIVLVTHHISVCLPIASYLLELEQGRILHQGTITELKEQGILTRVVEADEEEFTRPVPREEFIGNEIDGPGQDKLLRLRKPDRPLVEEEDDLLDDEERAEGRVSLHSYLTYMRAGGMVYWVLTVMLMISNRIIEIANTLFLAKWTEANDDASHSAGFGLLTAASKIPHGIWKSLPPPTENVRPWLLIYFLIFLAGVVVTLAYIILGYIMSLRASRRLFTSLLNRLTRAPSRWFDTTPLSRIHARFTKDMNTIDFSLQSSGRACITGVLRFVATFGVMLYEVPSFAPFALFIAWLYIRIAPSYIKASRDLRRLESTYLAPVFAGFDELHRGIIHVRAFGMEHRYQESFFGKVDTFQSFDHAYWLVGGWLKWRYDCLGSIVVFVATVFALLKGLSAGDAAVVITQAGLFADASRIVVAVAAQLELDFNAVERVVAYLDVDQEAPAVIEKNRPPAYWPSTSGELVVENLVVRYAPKLPAVLHGLTFTVRPSEKIGVVGRTGSGKSTLAMSMLRMVEATEGHIFIDGIDISTIGLEDLRTRITIISQDVSLFSGTIRSNLDPLQNCTDDECMQALERCHLLPLLNHRPTRSEPTVLDMKLNTESLSAGERQLLALARATLRHTSIIIMDEATSQIDSRLDDKIQHTIREELAGSIVLTIAHRLKTVMDYDRVLVLEEGRIVEFDTPKALLQTPRGTFREMCRKSPDWQMFLDITGAGSQRSSSEGSSSQSS